MPWSLVITAPRLKWTWAANPKMDSLTYKFVGKTFLTIIPINTTITTRRHGHPAPIQTRSVIGERNNRWYKTTMPLTLITMEAVGYRDQWKWRVWKRCRVTGKKQWQQLVICYFFSVVFTNIIYCIYWKSRSGRGAGLLEKNQRQQLVIYCFFSFVFTNIIYCI